MGIHYKSQHSQRINKNVDELRNKVRAKMANTIRKLKNKHKKKKLQAEKKRLAKQKGMSVDEDEIELLNKILKDEKEHIALLAGLQTKSTAQFVEPDNKDELDDYAQEVIETAPASESGEDGD